MSYSTVYQIADYCALSRNIHAEYHWLFDLDYMGTIIRIADAPLIIDTNPDVNGGLYSKGIKRLFYQEGLSVNTSVMTDIDISLWNRAYRVINCNCEISGHLALQKLDPLYGLTEAKGELSLWIKGLYYEKRFIVL